MVRRLIAVFFSMQFLALFISFQASGQDPKKDEPAKKEAEKNELKTEDPKKEPFVLDKPVREFKGHGDWINSLVISGDGIYLASASRDRTIKVWETATGKEVATLKGSPDNVKGAVFLEGSAQIASSTGQWNKEKKNWEGEIKIWDVKTGKEIKSIKGHTDTLEGLALSRDGKLLASGSADQTVMIWELETAKDILTLKGHTGLIHGLAFSSDGKLLATAGADATVKLWDASSGKNLATFKVESKVKSPDPKTEKDMADKDTPKKDEPKKDEPKKDDLVKKKAGKKDTAKKEEPKEIARPFTCVSFSPDDKKLVAGNLEGLIKIYDVETAKEIGELKAHEGVWALAFNADGTRLASAGWDQTIKIWDTSTNMELFTINAHTGTVTALTFTPDGQFLASAGIDGMVKIWSAQELPAKK